jgi:hypothetical protein
MEQHRSRLQQLRDGLVSLHLVLVRSEQADYELTVEKVGSAGQWLQLLLGEPRFAWLRELSGLIVQIDETLAAREPLAGCEAERLLGEAQRLLRPDEGGLGFRRHYFEAMQRDPAVILAHAQMGRVLSRLAG